jgi:hypothetical protein
MIMNGLVDYIHLVGMLMYVCMYVRVCMYQTLCQETMAAASAPFRVNLVPPSPPS